jgi:mono/diheme cytochrome c family protein
MPSQLKYIVEASAAILLAVVTVKAIGFFSSTHLYAPQVSSSVNAENKSEHEVNSIGRKLFVDNCARCHSLSKTIIGPPLSGIESRVPDKQLLTAWIRNNRSVLQSGNSYFNNLLKEYNNTPMDAFPQLGDKEIELILDYIEAGK